MVIIDLINEQYCMVADGDLRKIDKPKMKNIKHLQMTKMKATSVLEGLARGEIPENHVIRKELGTLKGIRELEGKEGW